MNIFSIQDKLVADWNPEIRSVVEIWSDYELVLEDFRKAIFVKSINHAKASQAKGWIFDGSQAKGAFSEEIQAFIDGNRFPAFAWAGLKYFVTINPSVSEATKVETSQDTRGLEWVELPSIEAAAQWIKAQAD